MIDAARDTLILLTDVARRQGVSYQTAKSWVDKGWLEAVKIGGSWKTTEAAINAFARRETIRDIDQPDQPAERKPQLSPATLAAQEHARQEMIAAGLL